MIQDSRLFFLFVITAMSSVALFATDIYLPALPAMAVAFNCSPSEIQASFTVFLSGLAMCQLVYGFLADKFGRKKITLIGLSVFIVASLLCVYATNLSEFLICRFLQAIGGGVGSVISRAIVADRFNRTEAVKIFSTTFPIIGLSGAIAPWVGGYLTAYFDWRSTFYFIAAFGVMVWLSVAIFLKDSKKEKLVEDKINLTLRNLFGYSAVLRNIHFLGYALVICSAFSVFRCYSVESPFVFDNQGYTAEEMGSFYIALSIAYILGNLLAKRLVGKMKIERVLSVGFFFFTVGGFCMVVSTTYFSDSPYSIILPMTMITFGNGFLFPISSAGAMAAVPSAFSGMASGLMGALQFIVSAICINWVGQLCCGQASLMAFFISGITLVGLCSYKLLILHTKSDTALNET